MKPVPIASDGWRFIFLLGVTGVFLIWVGGWWSVPLGVLGVLLAVFSVFFFRDFDRATPKDDYAIYSPGDGKVLDVSLINSGEFAGKRIIRIFLSVFDGHIQRSPVKGVVTRVAYKEGLFLDARNPTAHVDNEQNAVTIQSAKGPVVVIQIAGLIARRIVCWIKQGSALEQGERYGLIRFGSQVDVLMPTSVEVLVKEGDRVVGGESVVARWNS